MAEDRRIYMPGDDDVSDPHIPVGFCWNREDQQVHGGNIGRAWYVLTFPALGRAFGACIKCEGIRGRPPIWTLRVTDLYRDPRLAIDELGAIR